MRDECKWVIITGIIFIYACIMLSFVIITPTVHDDASAISRTSIGGLAGWIYNDEVQQINITDWQINPYIIYTEHGDVYQVENYSVFRQLVPGWHTVDVQVPVNPDKMPRIVGVRYP